LGAGFWFFCVHHVEADMGGRFEAPFDKVRNRQRKLVVLNRHVSVRLVGPAAHYQPHAVRWKPKETRELLRGEPPREAVRQTADHNHAIGGLVHYD